MPLTDDEIRSAIVRQLTAAELQNAIVYRASPPIAAGALRIGAQEIAAPWRAYLIFVDREPAANWGHSCRYILLNAETADSRSLDTRFPPFQGNDSLIWVTIYRAPTAPEWAVRRPYFD